MGGMLWGMSQASLEGNDMDTARPGGPPSASANTSSPANADAPDVNVDLIEVDDHITGPRPADTSDMVRVGITGR